MKKTFFFLILAVSVSTVNSQVSFGLKGGANLSNLAGRDADETKSRIGFNAGAFFDIPVAEQFSVKPELIYSLQGAKYSAADLEFITNTSYLNLPVLAKFAVTRDLFAETGPQLGLLVAGKAKANGQTADVKEAFNAIDFAWAFGVGYNISYAFGINARYNPGISRIGKDNDEKVKHSVFQLGIFFRLIR